MAKIKTSKLIGTALAWSVLAAEQDRLATWQGHVVYADGERFDPGYFWEDGGPIIEREGICLYLGYKSQEWCAECMRTQQWSDVNGEFIEGSNHPQFGPTPLVTAMRCYVASKLGDEVDVPEELLA